MSRRRRRGPAPKPPASETFWGDLDGVGGVPGDESDDGDDTATAAPREVERIVPASDPSVVPRSLGSPPLTQDTAAQHHLAVVYEEAVRTATALAAANGLLADDPS
jgi:hypothetical protein